MLLDLLLFTVGLIVLVKCAGYLVRSTVGLLEVVGLRSATLPGVLIGVGTSLPELAVSISDSISGDGTLAAGNIVGSNICNIFFIMGLAGVLGGLNLRSGQIRRQAMMLLPISVLFIVLLRFGIGWPVALVGLVGAVWLLVWETKGAKDETERVSSVPGGSISRRKVISLMLAGLIGLVISSEVLVRSGQGIAIGLGISDFVVGLLLVAVGTSLPELATVIVASRHKQHGVAVGTLVASNLFNILAVGGAGALFRTIRFTPDAFTVVMFVLSAVVVAALTLVQGRKVPIRIVGGVMLGIYAGYIISLGMP